MVIPIIVIKSWTIIYTIIIPVSAENRYSITNLNSSSLIHSIGKKISFFE